MGGRRSHLYFIMIMNISLSWGVGCFFFFFYYDYTTMLALSVDYRRFLLRMQVLFSITSLGCVSKRVIDGK